MKYPFLPQLQKHILTPDCYQEDKPSDHKKINLDELQNRQIELNLIQK